MTNPIKPTVKSEVVSIIALMAVGIASVYFYYHFPEQVPIHWNIVGEVDRWGSGISSAISIPLIMIGMYLMFIFIPFADPRKERYNQFRKVYHVFKTLIIVFMALIYFITGFNALGYNLPIGILIPALVGVLFVLIGNYMGKIKMNWFVGIRTPWTLSSEEVWNKTHRFGGRMFILAGLIMIITPFFPVYFKGWLFFLAIAIILLGTIFYSYILYLKETKNKKNENTDESTKL